MNIRRLAFNSLALPAVALLLAGCVDTDVPADEPVDAPVDFSGELLKGVVARADADGDESDWLDMSFSTWMWNSGQTPVQFVIHQSINDGSANSAVYRLKPTEKNRLECVDGEIPLNWKSKTAVHTFRSWTEPEGVAMDASQESGTVDMSKRNLDYEYFVGAKTEGLSYGTHGLTVALKYEHLVGKLIIEKVILIQHDGVETQNMWDKLGAISFPNMPTTGVFTTGVGGGDMAVAADGTGKGVLFSLAGNSDYADCIENQCIPFYVLPMSFVDNEDYGEFTVNVFHATDNTFRRYKGNLKDLVNEDASGNTMAEIKAGECLTVRLVLKDDEVKGSYAYIENWSDYGPMSIKDNAYPGIYTKGDLVANVKPDNETWKVFILTPNDDLIYEETEDGKKIIKIFDNLDLSQYKNEVIRIIVPEGYVLDGCGHNISGIPGLEFEGDVRNLYVDGKLVGSAE